MAENAQNAGTTDGKDAVKPNDAHASGEELTTQDAHASSGPLKPADAHASGTEVKPTDAHASSEPAN
ncbi:MULTISPECIES: hypothetical protein [Streptomyces]|uniref:Sigma-like protein n=1 Tax=Streptomyces cadmiisoli TaxID=2184053 RepID=A0A2Z4J1H4_9ACTN|nr:MULTISPECIES: hypothetical protein [Streptomyces]AWW39045.1 hypothetical protein DN051_22285 [Streptomyces cadmiisoli]KOV55989.1 hypothetical protein ADL00_27785 [Streptomyces sp. AS58]